MQHNIWERAQNEEPYRLLIVFVISPQQFYCTWPKNKPILKNMNQRIAKLFRLLLVIVMVIQPLQSAFAMSGMASMEMPVAASADTDVSCAYHVANDDAGFAHHSADSDDHGVFDDCCSTPACHAVGIISFVPSLRPAVAYSHSLFETSMQGITLPAERKPPRASHI